MISVFAFSQEKQEKTIVPHIRLKTDSKKDHISLRWAVDEPLAWQKANKTGFQLKRYTLMRDGKLLAQPEEKDLGIFLPAPEKEWQKILEKNDNAAIVAQSLFGESFEVEMGEKQGKLQGIVNKSQETDQRFAYALIAADLDFEVAKLAGWGYTDKDVKSNERYLYTVSSNEKNTSGTLLMIEKGDAIASTIENIELPKPLDFIGIFKDKTVTLSWEYLQLRDTYTSYYVEKSEKGSPFKSLGSLPVMNMNDSDERQAQGMIYVDSLAQNNAKFSYRIRGKTIFGDYGPYSDAVSGEGKKSLEASPRINNFEISEEENITIYWEFPREAEKDITSFELLHSETDLQNSYKVVKNKIPITSRILATKILAPSNYYKIQAIGKAGDKRESFSVLAQPNDTTPPETPIEFKGKIDSLGVVHLEWKANIEKDLEGYHIFRGIQKGEELVRLTPQAITKNKYEDKVVLENLNSKVYYYVTATDKRKNQSKPSIILELEKPDKVKPQTPVFTEYKLEEDGKITLKWLKSYSDDVAFHQLYRQNKESADKSWKMIYETKDILPAYSYTDKDVEADKSYNYYLIAIDKNKLQSEKSLEITLRSNNFEPQSALSNLSGSASRSKQQIELIWKIINKNIGEIVVYRQKGTEKPTLFGTLQGTSNFLEDKSVQAGNTYTYLLKPMLKNNQVAKTEKITVEY
jgi:fibronectin type 3 domain-containing protein